MPTTELGFKEKKIKVIAEIECTGTEGKAP